ncbi:MAG: YhdP family protein [Gammaproteobacteria bacterium]|nr:YhdP family protein [Gammaproteobacteria bacterium]MDH4311172.1 YhdP family protein [Gammaproteobacteria bacterium]MDH5273842.1 YhdP family protein [Gammaproteobacteria bacterium]
MTSTRWWRLVAGTAAGLLVVVALLLTALRIAIAYVPQKEQKLRTWIERQTHLKFEYSRLDARLRWYGPEVVLHDLHVVDEDGSQTLFATREGSIGLNLWNFLRTGQFVAGRVRVLEPRVTIVRLADGRIRLLGLRERPADRPPFDFDRLPAGRVVIDDATVVYRDLKTGSAPLELTGLDAQLSRDRDFVVMEGNAMLPGELGTKADFNVRLKGTLDEREHLDARVEIDADTVRLAGLGDFLPARVAKPLAGSGHMRGVFVVEQGRISSLRLGFELRNVALQLPRRAVPPIEAVRITDPRLELAAGGRIRFPTVTKAMVDRAPLPLPAEARYGALEGDVRVRREADAWVFRIQDLRAQAGTSRAADETQVWGRWTGKLLTRFGLELNVDGLDLTSTWPLALAFAPASFDRLAGFAPRGRVESLRASAQRERAGIQPTFTVQADLVGIGVQPSGRLPGVSGVSLKLDGNDQRGELQLRADSPVFEWPRLFRDPLALLRVTADGGWRRDGAGWTVSARGAQLLHRQGRAKVDAEFSFERPGVSPTLALTAEVPEVDISLVPQFVPVGRLRERTIAWLERAFVRGKATAGRLSYRGPVRRFPFRDGEGDFTAAADVTNATLDYYPGFAPLTNASGTVRFHNQSIAADIASGELGGLKLAQTRFLMADYKAPILEIDGKAGGDLQKALAYVQASPLGPIIGEQFMGLTGSGPAQYQVRLSLPVISATALDAMPAPPPPRDYTVRVMLDGVTVALPALRAPAQRVKGTFELHNYDVQVAGLRGTMLDGPFELSANPGRTSREVEAAVELTAQGRAGGARLPAFIGLPSTIAMSGATDWVLTGHIEKRRAGGAWPMRFDVVSDLDGLVIQAPRPFAKAAPETRLTRVRFEIPVPRVNDVTLESGSARARLRFAARDGTWRLDRGAARFDAQPVALPSQPGLLVGGEWPQFDLGEWLALSNTSAGGSTRIGGQRLMDWLGPVDVHLDRATVFGFEFRDVVAKLRGEGELWRIAVTGPQAEGQVTVPDDLTRGRPIVLDMKRLQLTREESSAAGAATAAASAQIDPRTLPAISARAEDFTWQSRQFGRLVAAISREPRGLTIDSIATTSPAFDVLASGSWWMEQEAPRTRLEVLLTSTDFRAASKALAFRDAIDASKAKFAASLWWPGGPSTDVLATLNGTLHVSLADGRLREIEPGAGRMLGLLSVAQLPRRLALDFRDVTDEGLAFNSVRGDFELRAGNAFTQNLLLKGPAIDMGIVGRTGLATEDYDQTIVVSGNPSGPLAVAGALAAGPVIGAGVLVLSQLFKDQLQGLTRAYYHVTGPWAAPVVQRIAAPAGDEASAGAVEKQKEDLP